ncbi:MAG TPA: hypothetical protein VF211_03555, partial [Burkholderiales bacterium]
MDLLTVLVHEIGHVLGFDHDSGPAVMAATLAAGQRVLLGDGADPAAAGAAPVTGALTRSGDVLVAEDADSGTVTFTILDKDGNAIPDVEVAGASSGNQIWNDVTAITGLLANLSETLVVGVDADTVWTVTGLNEGTVKVGALDALAFSRIDNLTGALSADDAFVLDELGVVTGDIEDRGGNTALDIADGTVLAVVPDGGTTWEKATTDVITGNAALGTSGTLEDANVRVIGLTGAKIFVGSGAALNSALDDIVTTAAEGLAADATGFLATGAGFSLISVTKDAESFLGLEATVTGASLLGVEAVDLQVSGTVKLNRTSRSDGERIDWATATNDTNDPAGLLPDLTLTSAQQLSASGTASLDIGPGNVVAVVDDLKLEMATADVVTGNAAITGLGTVDGTIDDANVLAFTITGASIFVGTGAQLNTARDDIETAGATGFLVDDADFSMASVTKGAASFTGLEVSVTSAALLGIDAVDLQVTGTVKLNQTSVPNGPRIDWATATTEPSTATNLLPALAIDQTQQLSVVAGASLNIGPGNVVLTVPLELDTDGTLVTGLRLDMATADVVTGNAAITGLGAEAGTIDDANVLAFQVLGASLFVGTGAELNGTRDDILTTTDEGLSADAIGFLVSGASFRLATVSKGATSFTGIEASVTSAALLGIDAIDLQVTGTVKLNQTSVPNGPRIDWATATTEPSTATNLLPTLTVTSAQQLSASGSASLDIGPGNVVAVVDDLKLEMATADVVTGNAAITGLGTVDGTIDDANVLTFTITGASLFVGTGAQLDDERDGIETEGAVGFSITDAAFSMASVSKGTASFTGLQVTVTKAALVGFDELTFGVYQGVVKVNSTSVAGGPKIDWQNATTEPSTATNLLPTLEIGSAVGIDAQGSVVLDAFGVLIAKGSFKLQLGTVTDSAEKVYQALVLTLGSQAFTGAEAVQVFVGVGGELKDTNGDNEDADGTFSDDVVDTSAGVGFFASLDLLSLVTLKDDNGTPADATDDKSYMALELNGMTAKLVGIDGLTFGVYSAGVKVNQASDTDNDPLTNPAKLDWTTFFDTTTGLEPAVAPDVDADVGIEAQGSVALGAFGVLIAKGSFKLQLGTVTDSAEKVYQALVLTLGSQSFEGAEAVQVFVGVGGELKDTNGDDGDADGSFSDDTIDTSAGVGFTASLQTLSLVTLKDDNGTPTDATDDKSYMALELNGMTAKLVGIDGLTFGVYSAGVKVNQASDTDNDPLTNPAKLDWTTFFDTTTGLEPAPLDV